MTAHERTGYRDEEISRRHRTWGFNVPLYDIDGVLTDYGIVEGIWTEYDRCKAVMFIDWKRRFDTDTFFLAPNLADANLQVLEDVAHGRPAYVIHYMVDDNDLWWFKPWCVTDADTLSLLPHDDSLTELEFVEWLYAVRQRNIPSDIQSKLAAEFDRIDADMLRQPTVKRELSLFSSYDPLA